MSIAERGDRSILPTYPPRPLALVRGEGCRVWDDQGREYLDLVAGLAVVSLGHAHPDPPAALARQARLVLGNYPSRPSRADITKVRLAPHEARIYECL